MTGVERALLLTCDLSPQLLDQIGGDDIPPVLEVTVVYRTRDGICRVVVDHPVFWCEHDGDPHQVAVGLTVHYRQLLREEAS